MVSIGARRPDVVAITAAMLYPTGLAQFAAAYPDRVYDVGIAEQHAVTSAAGLAMAGLHPVVAVYSTFLNRAFDQTLMDVALHQLPVTLVLDRAGVTGPDGASHHGMWDGSIMQLVPGMKIAAPRDAKRVAELLNEAVEVSGGPTVVRFPKGKVGGEVEAVAKLGGMDVLRPPAEGLGPDVLLVGAGVMALTGLEVADRLAGHGIGVTVVDPRWTKPVDEALVGAARRARRARPDDPGLAGRLARQRVARAVCADAVLDADPRRGGAGQDVRPAAGVPVPRHPRRGAGRGGPDPAAPGQADHRGGGAAVARRCSRGCNGRYGRSARRVA